jgi:osmotically-inducible protein OsmY
MSNHYSGYYWGMNPYDSSDLQGRIADVDLESKVSTRIRTMNKDRIKDMTISVKNAIVTLKGTVDTFQERRIIGRNMEHTWCI